ncbi:MAG: hypothetical protein WKF37_22200 [Bryobacteraceae bacterium]
MAFITTFTGRPNIWIVPAGGGWPVQLQQSDNRQTSPIWSADGKWIIYVSDLGGNEKWDIFMVPSDGGKPENLTNTPDISEDNELLSPDGGAIAFNYKPTTSPSVDVAVMDIRTRQVRKLTEEKSPNHLWELAAWSPDGKYVYANRGNIGFTDSSIYRIDIATAKAEELTAHTGEVLYTASASLA